MINLNLTEFRLKSKLNIFELNLKLNFSSFSLFTDLFWIVTSDIL
jgi:hypothetical protein